MLHKLWKSGLIAIVFALLSTSIVYGFLYRAPVAITENASTSYDMLPVLWTQNNDWLANNGFMSSSGNDTRVQSLGGLEYPWLVADNKTLTSLAVEADSQTNLYFVTGEDEASAMDIILGYGGYITRADAPSWELGNNGSIELSGWIDTTNLGETLWHKPGAFRGGISSTESGNITVGILQVGTGYPSVVDSSGSFGTGTAFNISSLSSAQGDLVIVYATAQDAASVANPVITPAAGFTQLYNTALSTWSRGGAWYKIITSTSEPAAYSWTIDINSYYSHQVFRIDRDTYSGTAPVSADVVGGAGLPDPPNLVTGWGASDVLWFASLHDRDVHAADAPAGYGNEIHQGPAGGQGSTTTSRKTSNAASENPGTYGTEASGPPWLTSTVAVRGASYTIQVSVAGLSSGQKTVAATADGTDLKIYIDSVEEDSTPLGGASVLDNNNGWIIGSNATPYMEYYQHTVNGTMVGWYQPTSMILTTVMPDRAGAAENGVITWGANPAGVGVILGSMSSSGQPSIGGTSDTSTSDILPPVGGTDWRPDAGVSATLLANPMRPIVTAISDNTTLSEYQVWVWLGVIFVVFVTVLVASRVRGHHLITGIALTAAIILMVVWTVFPWLTLAIAAVAIIFGLVSERSPSL